jgi:PTS system mannose-specific IID component
MQNLGFLFGIDGWLRRIYPDPEEYRRAALRHLEHFNTQPYMASFALGLVGALEEERASAPDERKPVIEERIRQLKRAVGAGLAAVGDSFFWGALRPACAGVTILAGLAFWTAGASHPIFWSAVVYLSSTTPRLYGSAGKA